jgi:hypothetical protein
MELLLKTKSSFASCKVAVGHAAFSLHMT